MSVSVYHTHTTFCDGKHTAEEMLLRAIELGCPEYGFSGHSYCEGDEDWCMSQEGEEEYRAEILRLREKYKDKIKVHLGIERDYLAPPPREPYDYVIGSVHTLVKNAVRATVDGGTYEERLSNIKTLWDGDPYSFVEDYFEAVGNLYEKLKPDIIGHFDIVCKFNEQERMFDENHPRYRAAATKALDKLLKTPATLEFNTGAVYRGYKTGFYPADFILERIAEAGRPMIISSDAHDVYSVLFGFDEAVKKLDSYGIKGITSLDELPSRIKSCNKQ